MNIRTIIVGAVVVVLSFIGANAFLNLLWPATAPLQEGRPALVAVPPLQPLTGTSTVLAPAAIALTAIRDALDAQAPRNLSGKPQNPVSQLLTNADLNFDIARGPLTVSGRPDALIVVTPLTGQFKATGTIASGANSVGNTIGNLVGGSVGQAVQNLAGKAFDQHADIQGTVTTTSKPTISPNWRLAPNLSAQVNVVDVILPIAGLKLSVANQVKPFLDNAVRSQTGALETRLRNDPFIENAARGEWVKLCRAIPLGAAGQGMPNLWLEVRPTRAIAAQPKIDGSAVTLLLGVQADTRIVPTETKPNCPFPQALDLVPQTNDGSVNIAVPIDIPFTGSEPPPRSPTRRQDVSRGRQRLVHRDHEARRHRRVRRPAVDLALVNVKKRGLFSFFGAEATVHVYGRPVLDQDRQILRFNDVTLDVQSQAAFGLLGAAAQAATPYLQKILADKAVIDLKPFAADAKQRIATAVSGFVAQGNGVSANLAVNDLRLTGIAYDDKTLRVIANATGAVNVAVSSLSMQ